MAAAVSNKAQLFQKACRARLQLTDVSKTCERPSIESRKYATQVGAGGTTPPRPSRRAITVTSDDGRYAWSQLSTGEKAARTTQQSFNFLLVGAGVVGTVAVAYLLYAELFAADSKTRQFNHAVDRVKADAKCRELLGPSNKIIAYGEPTSNKWARARPLVHSLETDKFGTEHFKMHFNVEGPDSRGTVYVHMTKGKDQDQLEYNVLSLAVPGHQTVYLENRDAKPHRAAAKMFGVQWR